MRLANWKAFVPTPKKAEEWTREMDWVIAEATNGWHSEVFCQQSFADPPSRLDILYPAYSADLEAVVRAAEKWCNAAPLHEEKRCWQVGNVFCRQGEFWATVSKGPGTAEAHTPALALAKALYAAVTAKPPVKATIPDYLVNSRHLADGAVTPTATHCSICGRLFLSGWHICRTMEDSQARTVQAADVEPKAEKDSLHARINESITLSNESREVLEKTTYRAREAAAHVALGDCCFCGQPLGLQPHNCAAQYGAQYGALGL